MATTVNKILCKQTDRTQQSVISVKTDNYYVISVTTMFPTPAQQIQTNIIARVMLEKVVRQTHTLLILQKVLTLKLIVNAFLATSNKVQNMRVKFAPKTRTVRV